MWPKSNLELASSSFAYASMPWFAPSTFSAVMSHIFWRNCGGTRIKVFDERTFTRSVKSAGSWGARRSAA
jgi:hypothetical protein